MKPVVIYTLAELVHFNIIVIVTSHVMLYILYGSQLVYFLPEDNSVKAKT